MQRFCNFHCPIIPCWMTQWKTGFSTKEPTIATLQHWIWGKWGKRKYKSRFFGVTLAFVQDCSHNHILRSNCLYMFYKIGFLKKFANFAKNYICCSLIFEVERCRLKNFAKFTGCRNTRVQYKVARRKN